MSRAIDDLTSQFRPIACALIAYVAERGVAVLIVDTLRTEAEHQANLASGASAATHSKHLPRRLRGVGVGIGWDPGDIDRADAIDLCPYETYQLHGPDKLQWKASDPAFRVIGEVAERLGLRWGGRWLNPVDPGHCELVFPGEGRRLALEQARPWPGATA